MYNIQKGLFMGLDGISINQLRVSVENNSAELNNLNRINVKNDHKVIDGLNEGQKIDPDKEKDKDNQAFDFENDEDSENVESNEEEFVPVIKYDLSDSQKYSLKLDENTNNILIIENSSNQIVQKISADRLSNYVEFLHNSQGSMINRKF